MHDFLTGLKYGFRGLPWLWRKGVRLYVVIPLLINSLSGDFAVIPEPSTLLLSMFGITALVLSRRPRA